MFGVYNIDPTRANVTEAYEIYGGERKGEYQCVKLVGLFSI